MDRDSSQPLSTQEAKARLRAAAQELSLSHWLSQRTWTVLAVALTGGFIVGRLRISVLSRALLLQRVAPLLLAVMLRRNK
jgi:hypothetical protein